MDYKPRETGIEFVKGVGEYRAKLFHKLGIYSVNDLLEYFPRDYQARLIDVRIRDLQVGQYVSMKMTVFSCDEVLTRKGATQIKALVSDGERLLECVWFMSNKWLKRLLTPGNHIWVNGQVGEYYGNLQLSHPQIEIAKDDEQTLDFWKTRKILPIYNLTANMTQNTVRNAVYSAFALYHKNIDETLPDFILNKYGFLNRKTALQKMHFATIPESVALVKRRFIYEEFFYLQLMVAKTKLKRQENACKERRHWANSEATLVERLKSSLPFALTNAQKRVIQEIFNDMTSEKPMNRLLQGDVGAGKTIVTLFAILLAVDNGFQTALIAPTEILAEQHFSSISRLLDGFPVKIALLKGGKSKQKTLDKMQIKRGEVHIAIGTHALIQKDVEFRNLSLVVIDEQHRFGVAQRAELSKRHHFPDLLYLSATPIPRSLAMTVFGEMTVSTIDELPPTRKPVRTIQVPHTKKQPVYSHIAQEIAAGRQVYIVCPLIEESEKLDLQDAETLYEEISERIFPEVKAGLLHGRLKQNEKDEIMKAFVAGQTKILVSTTVIEVGIDVPNASVMIVEHAERFGLAQLHQLRGRVGRGADQSYCYLIAYAMSEIGKERLKTMVSTNDGFVIAEKDLELRGPGDMFGTAQSGLPEFRFANLITDQEWLNKAKVDAELIIDEDPELTAEKHSLIQKQYYRQSSVKETLSQF